MPQSKLSAFLSVLLVFVGGVAVGGLGYRLYTVKAVAAPAPTNTKKMTPEDVRKRIVAHMKDSVKLDDQQVVELQKIMDQTREAFDQINQRSHATVDPLFKKFEQETQALREQQIAKVKAMLRPDQLPLYDKYLADRQARDAERKKKQQQEHPERKDGKGPGFPPPSRP